MEATSLRFAAAARALGHTARRLELKVPGFRSPPRLADSDRSLRRRPDGGAMVSVRLKGRPWMAVVSDMIEGVVAANELHGPAADAARRELWLSLEAASLLPPAPPPPPSPRVAARAVASPPLPSRPGRARLTPVSSQVEAA